MARKCKHCQVPITTGSVCNSCYTNQQQNAALNKRYPVNKYIINCQSCRSEFESISPFTGLCGTCEDHRRKQFLQDLKQKFFKAAQARTMYPGAAIIAAHDDYIDTISPPLPPKEEATEMAIMTNKIVTPQKAFNEIHLLLCGLIKQYGKQVGDKYVIELKNEMLEDAGFVMEQQRLSCERNLANNSYMVTLTFACSDEEQKKQYITETLPWDEYMRRIKD